MAAALVSGVTSICGSVKAMETTAAPLVNLNEIAEIELFVVKRMKEFTVGDHASVFKGGGFNFVGVRDWQPGDRTASIDWAQSSMTNFSPMITREFLMAKGDTTIQVPAAKFAAPGYYPPSYRIRWDASTREYLVSLTEFSRVAAR